MAKEPRITAAGLSVDEVPIDRAFLDIPDDANEAIQEAWKTYLITFVSAVAFIASVVLFILF